MAAGNFPDPVLAWTKEEEGGYVNHPRDPGGATNIGVTQRTYDAWRKKRGRSQRSVRLITMDEVADIYRTGYWNAISGDQRPGGVDYVIYDAAVNSGVSRAKSWAAKAASTRGAAAFIDRYCDIRMGFLRGLRHWGTFGKGWTRRVARVRARSHKLAGMPAVAMQKKAITVAAKAEQTRATVRQTTTAASISATTSAGSGAAGAVTDAGSDLLWTSVVLGLIALGLAIAAVSWWRQHAYEEASADELRRVAEGVS